jgi:hypothetical protein
MYFEVPKDLFKGLKQRVPEEIFATLRIVDRGEYIFDYKYLLEFKSKIEKVTAVV